MSEQSVLSRTVLSTAGMGVQGLARFAYTLAIGRLAGPAALGDTNTLLSVAVYLSLVLPAGLGVAGSRYLPDPRFASETIGLLKRWFWGASVALALLAVPVAMLIIDDFIAAVSCGLLVFSYNAYVFTRGTMMGEDRILRATIADFVSSLVAITALIAVLLGGVNWALLLPLALGYAIFAFASWPRTQAVPAGSEQRSMVMRFLRDSTVSALATGGLLPSTMVFVKAYDTPIQAGLFAAALSLATPASLVSQAVNQVLIPHFARMQNAPAAARRSHARVFIFTTAMFALVFGALILLAPWIMTVLYGERFSGGTLTMQVLLAIVFLISTTCAPSAYLVSSGHQKQFAFIWFAAFLIGTATMLVAAPQLGAWGAMLGFALGGGGGSLAVITAGFLTRPVELVPAAAILNKNRES